MTTNNEYQDENPAGEKGWRRNQGGDKDQNKTQEKTKMKMTYSNHNETLLLSLINKGSVKIVIERL